LSFAPVVGIVASDGGIGCNDLLVGWRAILDCAAAVHSMMSCPAAAQVQSPIWSLSIIPHVPFTSAAAFMAGGGAGSAGVV
jgi:hypothetical protein